MLQSILQLIEEHGLLVVFFNVLIEQAGAPVPAYPILVVTGAYARCCPDATEHVAPYA